MNKQTESHSNIAMQLAVKSAMLFKGVAKIDTSAREKALEVAEKLATYEDATKVFTKAMKDQMVKIGLPDGYARKKASEFKTVIEAYSVKCELLMAVPGKPEPVAIFADSQALKTCQGGYAGMIDLARAMLVKAGKRKSRNSPTGPSKTVSAKQMDTATDTLKRMTAAQLCTIAFGALTELRLRHGVNRAAIDKAMDNILSATSAATKPKQADKKPEKAGKPYKADKVQSGPVTVIPVLTENDSPTAPVPAESQESSKAA